MQLLIELLRACLLDEEAIARIKEAQSLVRMQSVSHSVACGGIQMDLSQKSAADMIAQCNLSAEQPRLRTRDRQTDTGSSCTRERLR